MDSVASPVLKDLVLVGGGHSHVAVLKRFGMKPLAGVRVTLISREPHAPYSGMLPGLIAGHYTFDEAHIDLGPLARFASARFLKEEVVGLDPLEKRILCADRPPVAYDVLSVNTGSAPGMRSVPGADGSVVPVKPIDRFFARWTRLRSRIASGSGPLEIGVVGGGAGGVELALAVRHGLIRAAEATGGSTDGLTLKLFTETREVLPAYGRRVRSKFDRILAEAGIEVHVDRRVVRVQGNRLEFEHAGDVELDEVLWVTTAEAPSWPGESGLGVDSAGFILVHDSLQSVSHPDVFAAGDVAAVESHPRPKSGVFAVRQGGPLADNLRRHLCGDRLVGFRPQRRFLSLISSGERHAVASRNGVTVEGQWVWRWKDWIDRRFMRQYTELPPMNGGEPGAEESDQDESAPSVTAHAMRCGGCGSKVGSQMLERALARLDPVGHPDVLLGLDAPDDAAVVRVPPGLVAVQTVDFFRAFIDDPFVFGRIAANHALGDIFAMGAEPQSALAIVTLPLAAEDKMVEDLAQLMAGALEILDREGTALVGGHTSEGNELSLGFSVTGVAAPGDLLRKSGMRPGDRLLLTKPIGTGVLFAAEMRGKARSRWIDDALRAMQESHRASAEIVRAHGATAVTDVTGFGLIGHLLEMARASAVDVDIGLDAMPLLDGVLEVAGLGIFSSLQPQNIRLRRSVRATDEASRDPRYPILFDPQTAGGLVASVPEGRADACLQALVAAGYGHACLIGSARPSTDPERPLSVRSAPRG